MLKSNLLLIVFLITVNFAFSQGRSATWCFGDSAGIQFTSGGIVGISCLLQSQEASASISYTSGNLIFCAGSTGGNNLLFSNVYNSLNQLIGNGDSIISSTSATQGLLILPFSSDTNKYLLFSIGFMPNVVPHYSLFSSTIDMNSGTGVLTVKNQIVDTTRWYNEKMFAVKHGNGRDWWLINHEQNSEVFIIRLIQNDTIVSTIYQNTGSDLSSIDGMGQMVFNPAGDKLAVVGQAGTINVFDFDRCTGILSNYFALSDNPLPGFDRYYGASISLQNFLYYSTFDSLWQINLNSANPLLTKVLVYADQNGNVCMGQHQLGPNGKIYIANAMPCGYPSTITDSLNTHLTVIDEPDSIGFACNILPYFQLIGGARSYLGLPNMPNYELGPLAGSLCDTLTTIHTAQISENSFEIFPNPVKSDFRIAISGMYRIEAYYELQIFNSNGLLIYDDKKYNNNEKVICSDFASGLYAIKLSQNGKLWFRKFIKL